MKPIHQNILDLAQSQDLGLLTYRKIGEMLGGEHPYHIQHNMRQLIKMGLLVENKRSGSIYLARNRAGDENLMTIPILGSVSCGAPTELANDEGKGFISVSPSLINGRHPDKLFALVAKGDSMNRANIGGVSVENNDFVIVRQSDWGEANEGDYVVSIIGDSANLKRFYVDRENRRFVLRSESDIDYPPIIIAEEDMEYYKIRGVATGVVKGLPESTEP